jgi:hypothetical protein
MSRKLYYARLAAAALLLATTYPLSAFAWDGYDYERGVYVEIAKGNLVRPGRTIEVYDYGEGRYKDYDVESVRKSGANIEIVVTDSETGEERTFEMDRRR